MSPPIAPLFMNGASPIGPDPLPILMVRDKRAPRCPRIGPPGFLFICSGWLVRSDIGRQKAGLMLTWMLKAMIDHRVVKSLCLGRSIVIIMGHRTQTLMRSSATIASEACVVTCVRPTDRATRGPS